MTGQRTCGWHAKARRIGVNIAKLPDLLSALSKPDANPRVHRRPM
jgi:hypothetical protein